MTRTFRRILLTAAILITAAIATSAFLLSGGCSATSSDPLAATRANVVNALIDQSGLKDRIEAELRGRSTEIAAQADIPQSVVDGAIDSLAIPEWQAIPLPESAEESATYAVETDDLTAQITTYDDPSIVTIAAYGQTITMEIPDSAQSYLALLPYLQSAGYLEP